MPQCVIIADDLTGANATGVLLKKLGYTAYTVMNAEILELNKLAESDCILCPTDSRAAEAKIAYNRVFNATERLKDDQVKVYGKRIDSTLRGNLGSETDAMLDAVDNQAIAMVVPCFPEAKRILVGGYLLVNMIPLHKTEASVDPRTPVDTSCAQRLFEKQSRYPVASIYIDDLMQGKEHIADKIKEYKGRGIRTIIFDSLSQEDMELIADGIILSDVHFIAVDPGSFTATMTRKLIVPRTLKNKYKILATVGSINPVAKSQVDELFLTQKVFNVYVETKELLECEQRRKAEIERAVREIINNCDAYETCTVIGNGIMAENRIDFALYAERHQCCKDEVSHLINHSLAEIAYRILKQNKAFRGIYTSGGDITVAVSKMFKAVGIRLLDEVVPLAAYGELIAGEFDGLKIVTKGGMVGDRNAMNDCIRYLKERLYL